MGVRNEYVDATIAAGSKGNAIDMLAAQAYFGVATFEVAAADDDASIFRLFKNVDPHLIPLTLRVACDALTGSTDWDMGLYAPLEAGGAEIDKDILADGINLSAGYSRILALDALVTVDLANARKRIFELAGHTLSTRKNAYDICLTANTIGSGAGTVTVFGTFIQG